MDQTQKHILLGRDLSGSNQRTLCCVATSSYLRCSRKMHSDVDFSALMNGLLNESLTVTKTSPALLNLFFCFVLFFKRKKKHFILEPAALTN